MEELMTESPEKAVDESPPVLVWAGRSRGMCCVELDSILYFFGGETDPKVGEDRNKRDLLVAHPPDFYILDTTTTSDHPSQLLRDSLPMKTGKPNPYAIIAHGKIYAIASRVCSDYYKVLSRFEVFDPVSNQWTCLPDPPYKRYIDC